MMPIETEAGNAAKHASSELDAASKYATGAQEILDVEKPDESMWPIRPNTPDPAFQDVVQEPNESALETLQNLVRNAQENRDSPEKIQAELEKHYGKTVSESDTKVAMTIGDLAKFQSEYIMAQQEFMNGGELSAFLTAQQDFFMRQSHLVHTLDQVRYSQMLGQCIAKQSRLLRELGVL